MTTLREAAELALKAIEQGETFGYLENVVAPTLEAALEKDRGWVTLTDTEIQNTALSTPIAGFNFARAIEAKLKEKNK